MDPSILSKLSLIKRLSNMSERCALTLKLTWCSLYYKTTEIVYPLEVNPNFYYVTDTISIRNCKHYFEQNETPTYTIRKCISARPKLP